MKHSFLKDIYSKNENKIIDQNEHKKHRARLCLNSKSSLSFPFHTRSAVPVVQVHSDSSAQYCVCPYFSLTIGNPQGHQATRLDDDESSVSALQLVLHGASPENSPGQVESSAQSLALGQLGCSLFWGPAALGTEQGVRALPGFHVSKTGNLYQEEDAC